MAIELSERVKSSLLRAQSKLRPDCKDVRWVNTHGLHLTLKFLGDAPDNDVAPTAQAISQAAEHLAPFDFEIAGCGCFPQHGPVRIVWAGVSQPNGALLDCFGSVERRLEALEFPRERRPFSPHLTLGRVREDRSAGRLRSTIEAFTIEPMDQAVNSLTLMSSELSPQGATYVPVSRNDFGFPVSSL